MNLTVINNEKPDICGPCGGKCCRNMPGICKPEDFQNDPEKVLAALDSGRFAIDWWEGDIETEWVYNQVYYVRPATRGQEGKRYDPSWGGSCTFLEATGCTHQFTDRPWGCRVLQPDKCGQANEGLDHKKEAIKAWRTPEWQEFLGRKPE